MRHPTEVARLEGCVFALDHPAVDEELRSVLLAGIHEAPERRMVRRYLDPAIPVVELGAALGVVSCITNRQLSDPARHVVVEPNPRMIPLLTRNRDRNGCRFTILDRALAYDAATVEFMLDATNSLASRLGTAGTEVCAVATTTLTQILDEHGFEACTLICDIEGAEVELVKREGPTLAERVAMMILEAHDRRVGLDAISDMFARLRTIGFDVVERDWETVAVRNNAYARRGIPAAR